jgi:hypothetical protein
MLILFSIFFVFWKQEIKKAIDLKIQITKLMEKAEESKDIDYLLEKEKQKILELEEKIRELETNQNQLIEIKRIEKALESIDREYFTYDESNKRYRLNIDVNFNPNSANMKDIDKKIRYEVFLAGKSLYEQMDKLVKENEGVHYLLIIEGNAQRYKDNWINNPELGYKLSYERALALHEFWKETELDFSSLGDKQCEVIIAGSGYFGLAREEEESLNRRFRIQITSKVGMYLNN